MATLEQLVAEGKLTRYEVDLEPPDQPERYILAAPPLVGWFGGALLAAPRDRGRNLTPAEQVDEALFEFIKGEPLAYGLHCRKLDPIRKHVWELKTVDVRLFGWFPRRATFVMVWGEMKLRIRKFKDYEPYVAQVADFRDQLCLDEPKALTGGLRDVL